MEKKPEKSTFKPLSPIFVPCLKIQGGRARGGPPPLPTPMLYNWKVAQIKSRESNLSRSGVVTSLLAHVGRNILARQSEI